VRILTAELRKTLTLRFFSVLLIAVIANFFLFRHNLTNSYSFYEQKAYIAAQQDVMAIPENQRLSYLQEKAQLLDACTQWETETDPVISEDMRSRWDIYTSGAYLQYTEYLFSERFLFRDLLQEVQQTADHTQTIESIIEEARTKTSVSIFAEPDSFSYRNQLAMIDRFEDLLHIAPVYDISSGVLHFQTSAVTDLIALVAILLFCTEMAIGEQKSGTLPILKATRKGRLPLVSAKLVSTAFISFLIACVLWGTNLGYCAASFGLGDLARPIQSLLGFTTCSLEVSVGEYLILFFLLKWVLYALVGILCLAAGVFWQESMPAWLTVGGFLGVGYILSQVISPIATWNILKFVNIGNLIFSTEWLSEYRNLDFFGYPVEVFSASWVLILVISVLTVALLYWLFCCRNVPTIRQPQLQIPQWVPFQGRSTALVGHESWKLLVECGAIGVLVLLLLVNIQEPRTISYDTNELHYKNYMERLAGPLTEEKQEYLEAESKRFAEIHQQIAKLRKDYAAGELSETDLNSLLPPLERTLMAEEILLNRVYPQMKRILQLREEGKEAHFVYEPGYNYLFGLNPQHSKAGAAALVVAGIILCFSNIFPIETSSGMLPILNVSKKGRTASAGCKLAICICITVIIFFIAQIPDYLYVLKNYGFPDLNAPLCSIEAFVGWNDTVSILEGIVLFETLRLVAAVCVAAIVLLFGIWTKNQLITLSVSTGLLLMPVLLNLLDIHFLDKISFLMPLVGSELLTHQYPLTVCVLYYKAVIILGTTSLAIIATYAKNGYKKNAPTN